MRRFTIPRSGSAHSTRGRKLNTSPGRTIVSNRPSAKKLAAYQKLADDYSCSPKTPCKWKLADMAKTSGAYTLSPFLYAFGFTSSFAFKTPKVPGYTVIDKSGRKAAIGGLGRHPEWSTAHVMQGPVNLLEKLAGEWGAANINDHYEESAVQELIGQPATCERIDEIAKKETFEHWQSGTAAERKERKYGAMMSWQGRKIVLAGSYHGLIAKDKLKNFTKLFTGE